MTKTYKVIVWLQLVLLLGFGFKVSTSGPAKLGDSLVSTIATHYVNGINVGSNDQFQVSSTGATTQTGNSTVTGNETVTGSQSAGSYLTATVGVSSSSPAALGSAAAGFVAIPAGNLLYNASSSAITSNSQIFLTQLASATSASLMTNLGATLCNTNVATTTPTVRVFASSTAPTTNGFSLTLLNAPASTPFCYSYHVIN